MAHTNLNISVDTDLINKAQSFFGAMGIDVSTGLDMLLRKAIYQDEVSFDIKVNQSPVETLQDDSIYLLKPDPSKKPEFGCMSDCIVIPPEFYEPLEEMKEYMY